MPKSRRDHQVTTSRTTKKIGLEPKQALVDKIRQAVDAHARCFVFTVANMRNRPLKSLRESRSRSQFFLGKNRVMALALGKSQADEYSEGTSRISAVLRNQCGLLFTNDTRDNMLSFFDGHGEGDFARTGGIATETVTMEQGALDQFPHSMEPQLRSLGLPTSLKKGVVHLLQDYTVCKEGDVLTSEQARILKLLGHKQATFKLNMIAVWNNDGTFEILDQKLAKALAEKAQPDADEKDEDEEMSS